MLHNYILSRRVCSQSTSDEHILHCETLLACHIGFLEGGMLSFHDQCSQCLHAILLLARNEPVFLALVRQARLCLLRAVAPTRAQSLSYLQLNPKPKMVLACYTMRTAVIMIILVLHVFLALHPEPKGPMMFDETFWLATTCALH